MHKLNYDAESWIQDQIAFLEKKRQEREAKGLSTGYVCHDIAVLKYLYYLAIAQERGREDVDKERVNRYKRKIQRQRDTITRLQDKLKKVQGSA